MKRILLVIFLLVIIIQKPFAQKVSAKEQQLVDSVCAGVNRLDLSKINTKDEAVSAYTQCIGGYYTLLSDLAEEKHLEITSTEDMKKLGVQLVQDLMTMKCENFMKLENLIAKNATYTPKSSTTGVFKRVDNKGFDNIVITDENKNEQSFLWLRQFPGSENFMSNTAKLLGKKVKIGWQEIEVYLPVAKGYYKRKEITSIEVL